MMSQLAFRWPTNTSYATEDFIVSDCNAEAVRFLEVWPDGSGSATLLCGPSSSGKTHLAYCWLASIGGVMLDKSMLGRLPSDVLWQENVPALLEDIDNIVDEEGLFHLLRHAETEGKSLLLTSSVYAKQLPFYLPDLCSRIIALPIVSIDSPDEQILNIFIMKCFADRQLRVSEDVAKYIIKRVERSFAAVLDIVASIETISLEAKKDITLPLVKKVLQ